MREKKKGWIESGHSHLSPTVLFKDVFAFKNVYKNVQTSVILTCEFHPSLLKEPIRGGKLLKDEIRKVHWWKPGIFEKDKGKEGQHDIENT